MKQNTVFSPLLALFILAACTKGTGELAPLCVPVCIVSDKYTKDTVFLKRDILYRDCLSGHWLDTMQKAAKVQYWYGNFCDTSLYFKIEHLRTIIGNKIPSPYKK